MNSEQKKAAIAAYKQKKPVAGVFAIRCSASGQVWVGHAPDLGTIQNRIWFSLRMGNLRTPADLQQAWNTHGGERFTFEALETIEEDEAMSMAYARAAVLKERQAFWRARLDALTV